MTEEEPRKSHLWEFDPSTFQPLNKAGFIERRILGHGRTLAKYTLFTSFFAYPIVLVSVGVAFGGIVFWSTFAGSNILIWLVLKKTGYAHNFDGWDISYKKFVGLVLAFLIMLGVFYSFTHTVLKIWTVPLFAGLLIVALVVGGERISRR